MHDYDIVTESTADDLCRSVKKFMENKWIPNGGIAVSTIHVKHGKDERYITLYHQAIILIKDPDYGIHPQHVPALEYQKKITKWKKEFSKFKAFSDAYPIVNVKAELEKASLWLYTNTSKKKKAFDRFFNNWCARIQEKGIQVGSESSRPIEDL